MPRPKCVDVVTCVAAEGRVLQGRARYRAVLYGKGRQPGRQRRHLLQQVQHGQRLNPLAERGRRQG